MNTIDSNTTIIGTLDVTGGLTRNEPRSNLTQEDLSKYPLPVQLWYTWDAPNTGLPTAAANDDLGIPSGTFGTDVFGVEAGDLKAAGATTRYAGFTATLPHEYVAGQSISIRLHAGMKTTVADNTATIDLEAHSYSTDYGLSADICTTAAASINSLTFADVDFSITPTGLTPGDMIQCRVAIAVNDAATGTAVDAAIQSAWLLADSKG